MQEHISYLHFFSQNWQVGYFRTVHAWLLQVSMWHYWFWFTFALIVNFFYSYTFKSVSYNRADVRGRRATGEKRRVAWPEVFIILMPLFWASSIIFQAFTYLRILEHNGGYSATSVQLIGYQWGWKYCYSESTYFKLVTTSRKIGSGFLQIFGLKQNLSIFFNESLAIKKKLKDLYDIFNDKERFKKLTELTVDSLFTTKPVTLFWENNQKNFFFDTEISKSGVSAEIYFCRQWLTNSGVLQNVRKNTFSNQLFQTGLWVTAQGLDPNVPIISGGTKFGMDNLRLLRSTGSLVLPTRVALRLMTSSEDVTHSWAVPGIGLKIDCVPGRLFYVFNVIMREGTYYGQCSELCGWNHYNMPISVSALPYEHFLVWWELELHNVFTENTQLPAYMYENNEISLTNYQLLNKKYK